METPVAEGPTTTATATATTEGPTTVTTATTEGPVARLPSEPTTGAATPAEPPLPFWFPHYRGKPLYHGSPEALAWALDGIGRAVAFIAAGAFLSTALLRAAKEQAGCETEPPPGENKIPDCDETVYGMRPSSLLTTYTAIVGLASAAILPFMGAVVDLTPRRLMVGRITTFFFVILILPQVFISDEIWFVVAVLQVIISFFGWGQSAISYAYLPELSPDDQDRFNDYSKNFTVTSFSAMVLYLGFVISLVTVLGLQDDEIATARIGMGVAFGVSGVLLFLAWGCLFRPRPALNPVAVEQRGPLLTAGFVQLYRTSKRIIKHHRALKWFYISIAFSDSGLQALATIAITYLTDQLNFSGRENGIAILCLLLGSIPGGVLSNWSTRRFDPRISSMMSLVMLIVTTTIVALLLTGPGQQTRTYILAAAWGIGTGWKWTGDRLVASSIIPEGQDAELMGTFLFVGQSLSWVPPLAFTAINESGASQRLGIASLNAYFILALVSYWIMGSYANARREVGREDAEPSHPKARNTDETAATNATSENTEQNPV